MVKPLSTNNLISQNEAFKFGFLRTAIAMLDVENAGVCSQCNSASQSCSARLRSFGLAIRRVGKLGEDRNSKISMLDGESAMVKNFDCD